ncbi:MAG: peptidoglycan DD-metalloendopeptidase family protein [Gloeomargaritaceae cyanobacterium C42_A2020_066]|nr:peptidoglycan DD-metalloendopeptidase family protein [Gloeomargaritaceae cyanobacterium C42_A2020_066]
MAGLAASLGTGLSPEPVQAQVAPSTATAWVTDGVSPETPSPTVLEHRVLPGQSLWQLAQLYRVEVADIATANKIQPDEVLQIGRVLQIPLPAVALAANEPGLSEWSGPAARQSLEEKLQEIRARALGLPGQSVPIAKPSVDTAALIEAPILVEPELLTPQAPSEAGYRVQRGDTLTAIARRYQVSMQALIRANRLANPNSLEVGQQLMIPGQSQATAGRLPSVLDSLRSRQALARAGASTSGMTPQPLAGRPVAPTPVLPNLFQGTDALATPTLDGNGTLNAERQVTQALRQPLQPLAAVLPKLYPPLSDTFQDSLNREALTLPSLGDPGRFLPQDPSFFRGYAWPARGVLTSGFGRRWGRMHQGIDIAGPVGTPILAAADGEVISSGWNSGGYGNLVKIWHPNGTTTLYAHNSRLLVRVGQQVRQGQQIAEMGSTGFSTGPHLHFEIRPRNQGAVNPIALLPNQR